MQGAYTQKPFRKDHCSDCVSNYLIQLSLERLAEGDTLTGDTVKHRSVGLPQYFHALIESD